MIKFEICNSRSAGRVCETGCPHSKREVVVSQNLVAQSQEVLNWVAGNLIFSRHRCPGD